MADYKPGYAIAAYLRSRKENIVGIACHPKRFENKLNRGYTEKIKKLLHLPRKRIFSGDDVQNGKALEQIKKLRPDIVLLLQWGYILKPEAIALAPTCINLHFSYLPFNRGKNPNVWSIIDGTPAGITFHMIDPGIDTGDIIAQATVPVVSIDTGKDLYEKLNEKSISLFKEIWPRLAQNNIKPKKQKKELGVFHKGKDLQRLDYIDLDKKYQARNLINLLRARTFPPFPGAYFMDDSGKKVYIRVYLEYEKESEKNKPKADPPSGTINHRARGKTRN